MNEREAASAPAAAEDSRNLLVRVAAALVLAPVAVAAAWVGGWWWVALVTLAAIGLYLEWLSVTCPVRSLPVMATGAVALALAAPFLAVARVEAALAVLAIGLVALSLRSSQARLWAVAGYLYAALAQLASVMVRLDPAQGLAALILVLLVVWGTDIGGYFAGRGIGGPRLWPRVSPKKTWAGSIGGLIASLLVATGFWLLGYGKPLPLLVLAAALSIAAQFGDLLESAVKRRFGVKDSSHIIPGHGGLMDRLDGFVAAIVLAAIFGALRGGVDGVGRALMVW